MRLDGTDLASANGATNQASLLVLRSRLRLVPEKYFPADFTFRRPDAGGHVRSRIRKTHLHEDTSHGVESNANNYKRRSTSTLSIQNRSIVLHASFEKTKMGSIEIYDHKNKRWVPYVPDYKKWEQHFTYVLEGRARADHRGRYLVGIRHSQSRTGDAGGADSRDGQVGIGSTESYKRKETQRFFQPTGRTMNHLEENHENELSVFTPQPTNTGVHARK
jgi:hypothetical protein